MNKIGPSTEPCWIPQSRWTTKERTAPRRTYCVRPSRYDWNHFRAQPSIPKLVCSRSIRISWSTVSNAAERSRRVSAAKSPWSTANSVTGQNAINLQPSLKKTRLFKTADGRLFRFISVLFHHVTHVRRAIESLVILKHSATIWRIFVASLLRVKEGQTSSKLSSCPCPRDVPSTKWRTDYSGRNRILMRPTCTCNGSVFKPCVTEYEQILLLTWRLSSSFCAVFQTENCGNFLVFCVKVWTNTTEFQVMLRVKWNGILLFDRNTRLSQQHSLKRCAHCALNRTTALDTLTHDVGRLRTTPDDVVRSRTTTFRPTCKLPCRTGVVAMSYDIVRYVNSAVKSMSSITATSDDTGRTTSYDIVRCCTT